MLKEAPHSTIIRAIDRLARGEDFVDPALAPSLVGQRPRQPDCPATEREILQLLADGMSNADVAKKLFISQETVKSHVRHILAKLEADTRTQAVAIALRESIISYPLLAAPGSRHPARPCPLRAGRVAHPFFGPEGAPRVSSVIGAVVVAATLLLLLGLALRALRAQARAEKAIKFERELAGDLLEQAAAFDRLVAALAGRYRRRPRRGPRPAPRRERGLPPGARRDRHGAGARADGVLEVAAGRARA